MCETFDYIFEHLRSSEKTVKSIMRTLKRQKSFNRNIAFIVFTLATYITANEIIRKQQNRKIGQLSDEIERLKYIKGV